MTAPRSPGLPACYIVAALKGVGDMQAIILVVERPGAAHVDHAGSAALDLVRLGRLAHRQLGEQLGREHVEVDFAVVVGLVGGAGGGHRDLRVVEQDLGEVGAETADRDVHALTVDFAADGDAWNAVQRFGDVGVGKFADVFGEDRVGEIDRSALGVGCHGQAGSIAGDRDGFFPSRNHLCLGRERRHKPAERQHGCCPEAAPWCGPNGILVSCVSLLPPACLPGPFFN